MGHLVFLLSDFRLVTSAWSLLFGRFYRFTPAGFSVACFVILCQSDVNYDWRKGPGAKAPGSFCKEFTATEP